MKIIELDKEKNIEISKEEETVLICDNKNIFLNLDINIKTKVLFVNINFAKNNISQDININLNKPDSKVEYICLEQLNEQENNILLKINHLVPNTESLQIFRGIYAKRSSSDFLGQVIVDKTAIHSIAKQDYKALLLSPDAKAKVRPELEINNSEVKVSHGASIGCLDEDALFYLLSRGISLKESTSILLYGFSSQVLNQINNNNLKEKYSQLAKRSIENL